MVKDNLEYLKVDNSVINKNLERKKFVNYVVENPNLLGKLSNDRLKIMVEYYQEENRKKQELLKNLSNKIVTNL